MPYLQFTTLDVFTSSPYTGNPLAVIFLPAEASLSQQSQKQIIAREFNLSETIFIHEPKATDNKRSIDIFTTDCEIPFAGHPTIGAAAWFLQHSTKQDDRQVDTLITKAGEIPVSLRENVVSAQIAHNVRIHANRFPASELLRLHPSLRSFINGSTSTFPIVSIVNGMAQVHVELPSLSALQAVTTAAGGEVVSAANTTYLDDGWRSGLVILYFFVRGVPDSDGKSVIRTRAILGNLEDPATGSAASGLAAYLSLTEGQPGEYLYDIVQGVEMGRRSEIGIGVKIKGDRIERVELRGSAVMVSEGRVLVPLE